MNVRLTDSEMLEKRCQAWEKTRQRGQFLYALVRGMILSFFWMLLNILRASFEKNRMSYESMAAVSFVFFLVGCWEAPQSWKKSERRYEADKQYLQVMERQDSNRVS